MHVVYCKAERGEIILELSPSKAAESMSVKARGH